MKVILRLKRLANEPPCTALSTIAKRARIEEPIFQYLGTADDADVAALNKLLHSKAPLAVPEQDQASGGDGGACAPATTNFSSKSRLLQRPVCKSERYRIVDRKRHLNEPEEAGEDDAAKQMRVIDIERTATISMNGIPLVSDKEDVDEDANAVYDCFTATVDEDDMRTFLEEDIELIDSGHYRESYEIFENDIVRRTGGEETDSDTDNEDNENNWRNNYPDEEDCYFPEYDRDEDLGQRGSDSENEMVNTFERDWF